MKARHSAILIYLLFTIPVHVSSSQPLPSEIRFGETGGTDATSAGGRPTGTGLVELAGHLGYFVDEFGRDGPKITQVYFAGTGPAQNEALAQGSIDFGTYGGVPNVLGLVSGIPAHIVATRRSSGTGTYYIGVANDSPIKTVTDLKGKRITVQKGTNPYQSLVQLLAWKGLDEKDMKLINLQGNEALVAFNAGAVDAVYGGVNLLVLRDQGKLRVLDDTKDFHPVSSQGATLVSERFENDYRDVVKRVVKVLTKASWWASDEKNREALLRFIASRSLAYKHVAESYRGSLKERYNPLIDESSVAAYKDVVQFCLSHKLIRKEVDETTIRDWFRPEYQQAALKELKLEQFWTGAGGTGQPIAAK
jgi:sulfonate transport system substrate-binding protein